MITKWQPEKVKAEFMDKVEGDSEIVGKFVETDARRRLMGITDPEWGRAYRQKLVARLLMYQVKRTTNEIITSIGVGKSSSGEHHGFYIEVGSKTAPAHPFLRPAIFENQRKILALLTGK